MRVLVTGGAGFIGSNLVGRLLAEGDRVDVVDDLSNGHLQFVPKGQNCRVEDFASPASLQRIHDGNYEVIYHLAALPRVSYSVEKPFDTHLVNVCRTVRMLDSARGNVGRIVFASSSSVYGGADKLPTPETFERNPRSPYALQKAQGEDYLKMFYELYGLDSACMRFFNVFGPNQLGDSPYATAVSAWLSAIKKGKPMRSDGDGTQSRDMCYVDNVVDACIRAARHPEPLKAECFNVACGDRTTNNEILEYLMKRYPGATKVDAPWRPGDVMHTQANVNKAKKVLGYKPLVKFWDGLERTIEWVENTPEFTSLGLRI
jgi:UDP-glucose 4-epimerase